MPSVSSLFSLLRYGRESWQAFHGMRTQPSLTMDEHLRLCGDWLLLAHQQSLDGGYAASFSLLKGWSQGYVETTGYIIPTMFDITDALHEPRYRTDALAAAEWLLTRQLDCGGFPDLDGSKPTVFDTGQVLIGLERLTRETKDPRFSEAGRRAGEWLLSVQHHDGGWLAPTGTCKTYETRTAAALIAMGQTLGRQEFVQAGERALDWAASQQGENGFFAHCELRDGEDSLLHTMVYVLEGFLMAWKTLGDRKYLDVALQGAAPLLHVQLTRDLIPVSYYRADWSAASTEKCLTGLAQWALLCFELHGATSDPDYLRCGQLALYYVSSKQILSTGNLHGALPASVPVWGQYQPYSYVNWGVKFFADAILRYRQYDLPAWRPQEEFVRQSLRLQADAGRWEKHSRTLDALDTSVMEHIAASIIAIRKAPQTERIRVLDLGCGEGRCLNWLREQIPDGVYFGVDPVAPAGDDSIRVGSAYDIPFPDQSFDVLYSYIVLAHVSDLSRVLSEISRVLKPGGLFIVADRHRYSARGVMKPWHELRGRWIYAWDAPFRERWYSPGEWRRNLAANGFDVHSVATLLNPKDRGMRRLLATNRFLVIAAQKRPMAADSSAANPVPALTGEYSSGEFPVAGDFSATSAESHAVGQ